MGVVVVAVFFMEAKIAPCGTRAYCTVRLAAMRAAHNLTRLEPRSPALLLRHRRARQPEPGGGAPAGFPVDPHAPDARVGTGNRRTYFRAQCERRRAHCDRTCAARRHATPGRALRCGLGR